MTKNFHSYRQTTHFFCTSPSSTNIFVALKWTTPIQTPSIFDMNLLLFEQFVLFKTKIRVYNKLSREMTPFHILKLNLIKFCAEFQKLFTDSVEVCRCLLSFCAVSDGRASDNPRAAQKGRPKGSSNRGKDGGGSCLAFEKPDTICIYLFDTFYVLMLTYRLSKKKLLTEC